MLKISYDFFILVYGTRNIDSVDYKVIHVPG